MALSDREKKVLEELERGLFADDAEFAKRVEGVKATQEQAAKKAVRPGNHAARLVGGALLAVVGLSVLLLAAIAQYIAIGIVGFIITLAGVVIASSNWSNSSLTQQSRSSRDKDKKGSFFEDRWDRRTNPDN